MHEAYLGIYKPGANGLPVAIDPERLCSQGTIPELAEAAGGPRLAAGFGWQRYPELLASNREYIDDVVATLHPRARYLLDLGAAGLQCGAGLDPKAISPAYLRQKVAEKPAPAT